MELTLTATCWIQIDEIIEMIHKYDVTVRKAVEGYIDALKEESNFYNLIGEIETKQIISEVYYQLMEEK